MENLPIHEPKSQWSRYVMDDIDRAIKISVSFASNERDPSNNDRNGGRWNERLAFF